MEKKHFKLYKSGKQWLSMALVAVASLALGMTMATVDGQADASIQNDAVSTAQAVNQSNNIVSSENAVDTDVQNVPTQSGLVQRNNGTYYYNAEDHSYTTNDWKNINNSWYHFADNGEASTGWFQSQAGLWYHFDEKNAWANTGWYQSAAGNWYYFDQDNAWALTGWQNINNHWYHFDETNAWANKGWFKSNAGFWYYFDQTNAWADTGWQYINNAWYYFDPANAWMLTGTHVINGTTYNFNADGSWADDHSGAVNKAMSVRGTSYVWGGNNPYTGFDCSGLVQWAYGLGGNYRTTYQQQTLGAHHYDVANAPKGSLLFFGGDSNPYHVAISLGNGAYVHAPQPGDVVKVGYTKYYSASYYVVL